VCACDYLSRGGGVVVLVRDLLGTSGICYFGCEC